MPAYLCQRAHVLCLPLNVCRIQLELVEDKLRELRLLTLDPREYDDKTVTLSQLDRVRQELLATAKGELKYVTFGKVRPKGCMPMQCGGTCEAHAGSRVFTWRP